MERENKKMPDNVVFVGIKPFMNYTRAVQTQFQDHNEVFISARGKNISRAVDIEEVIIKRFMKGEVELSEIKLDSEEFEPKESKNNKKVNVSSIEIKLVKKSKDL